MLPRESSKRLAISMKLCWNSSLSKSMRGEGFTTELVKERCSRTRKRVTSLREHSMIRWLRKVRGGIGGRRWKIRSSQLRFNGEFSPRHDRLTGLWERSEKGEWQAWIELELKRAY